MFTWKMSAQEMGLWHQHCDPQVIHGPLGLPHCLRDLSLSTSKAKTGHGSYSCYLYLPLSFFPYPLILVCSDTSLLVRSSGLSLC